MGWRRVMASSQSDGAVGAEGPPGVVGNLPRVTVRVDEHAGIAAPRGGRAGAADGGAGRLRVGENRVDLGGGGDVVGQRAATPACTITTPALVRKVVAAP